MESASSTQSDPLEMQTLCGAAFTLRTSSEKYSGWRPATIGGIVLLNSQPYALTAAHIFLAPRSRHSKTCCDKCGADDYNRRVAPPSGTSWWHMLRGLEEISEARYCPKGRNCAAIESDAEFVVTFKDEGLRRFSTSMILEDLPGTQLGYFPSIRPGRTLMNLDYGWALIGLLGMPISRSLNHIRVEENYYTITSIKPYNREAPVLECPEEQCLSIATSRGNLDAYVHAAGPEWLAGSTDGHSKLVWRIQYDHRYDDIGSWMVDRQRGQLWGIVVSLGHHGTAEVLPAATIFDDIKQTTECNRVTMPGQYDPAIAAMFGNIRVDDVDEAADDELDDVTDDELDVAVDNAVDGNEDEDIRVIEAAGL